MIRMKNCLLLLFSVFYLSSCIKEPTRDTASSHIEVENTERIGASIAVPDTEYIDTPRLANSRLRHGIDIAKLIQNPRNKSILDATATAIERALRLEEVRADTELYIDLNYWLGSLHSMNQKYEETLKYFRQAEDAAKTDKSKYRMYLLSIYRRGAHLHAYLRQYSEAIRKYEILIEEYQGTGSGINKNQAATMAILNLAFLSQHAQGLSKEDAENIKSYLIQLTKKYHRTEIGIAAVASLYSISKREGDEQKAQQYLIEMSSYPATPEFRRYSESVIKMWEDIEARKEKAKIAK